MSGRICLTPAEAFEAGFAELCEHEAAPERCPQCRLTPAEIGRLVVLLQGAARVSAQPAAA
ncbi:hypothetical protein [Streptomyces sp. NPDC047070]|uniref:hypothetical protein n=1 Tax=Streptomyces sp. NPDC047070 TaxID=3154923 RepID=UPI00345270BB